MSLVAEESTRAIHQLAPAGARLMHCTEYVHIVPRIGERLWQLCILGSAQGAIVFGLAKALAYAALRCGRHGCARRCRLLPLLCEIQLVKKVYKTFQFRANAQHWLGG